MRKNIFRRFLTERIDRELGSLEKELKYDKIMIIIGALLALISIAGIIVFQNNIRILIFMILLFVIGVCITLSMIKEYMEDKTRL